MGSMRDECRQYVMDTEVGNNFVELLGRRAREYSDKIAVTFLLDGEVTERSFTYAQLDLRSRAIAVRLLTESCRAIGSCSCNRPD
jgi:acyl-CoA synthetase (AMP-forming)/AMP-acid ligase II